MERTGGHGFPFPHSSIKTPPPPGLIRERQSAQRQAKLLTENTGLLTVTRETPCLLFQRNNIKLICLLHVQAEAISLDFQTTICPSEKRWSGIFQMRVIFLQSNKSGGGGSTLILKMTGVFAGLLNSKKIKKKWPNKRKKARPCLSGTNPCNHVAPLQTPLRYIITHKAGFPLKKPVIEVFHS